MKNIILRNGAIAGALAIGTIIISLNFTSHGDGEGSEWLGYLIMLAALSLVFVGIKQYRDQKLGGVIKFGNAALIGLGMSVVAGVAYVVGWEIYLAFTDYAFLSDYVANSIAAREAEGLSGDALTAFIAEMEAMEESYSNLFYRLPVTFLEIFPPALVVTLVSASILRNPAILPARA